MTHGLTERGFRYYRFEHLGCHGQVVKVVESSIAFEGAHVRIFHGDDEHVQLHVDAAEAVAHALLAFVQAARDGELTEPCYTEDGDHGHDPAVAMVNATEFAAAFPDAPDALPPWHVRDDTGRVWRLERWAPNAVIVDGVAEVPAHPVYRLVPVDETGEG